VLPQAVLTSKKNTIDLKIKKLIFDVFPAADYISVMMQ
jgi:hypothetical protein